MGIGIALVVALAAWSPAPEASAPLPAASTAASQIGEVAITTTGRGKSSVPAERASMVLNLRCAGQSQAEAQTSLDTATAALIHDLLAIGVPRKSIVEGEQLGSLGFIGNEAFSEELPPEVQQQIAKRPRYATTAVTVVLDDLALLPKVQQLLRGRGAVTLERPDYELRDDRAARQLAIADAIRRARAEAQAYAASVGMRVDRLTGIRDLSAAPSVFGGYPEMMKQLSERRGAKKLVVETEVDVAADFILTSR